MVQLCFRYLCCGCAANGPERILVSPTARQRFHSATVIFSFRTDRAIRHQSCAKCLQFLLREQILQATTWVSDGFLCDSTLGRAHSSREILPDPQAQPMITEIWVGLMPIALISARANASADCPAMTRKVGFRVRLRRCYIRRGGGCWCACALCVGAVHRRFRYIIGVQTTLVFARHIRRFVDHAEHKEMR